MAQPQVARVPCPQCNASYNSERELHDHMQTAHREFGAERSSSQPVGKVEKGQCAPLDLNPNQRGKQWYILQPRDWTW